MTDSLISVIVPIYNSEKFLSRCIKSIISQSYTNWELLLINDGSQDKSLEICNEYMSKDPRIKVFNQSNSGVSSARNLGIKNANGTWITFIDSDDWIEKNYLENFNQEYDLCLQGYYKGDSLIQYKQSIVNANPGAEYLYQRYVYGPYCKLFKSEIIHNNNILFDLGLFFGEDILFLMQYIIFCKSMYVSEYCGYHYTIENTNSLTRKKRSFAEVYNQYHKHIPYYDKIMTGHPHYKEILRKQVIGMFMHLMNDYQMRYKDIKKNEFMKYYYKDSLYFIDKIFIFLFPIIGNKIRTSIIKLLFKYN